jgi:hypothetical protein
MGPGLITQRSDNRLHKNTHQWGQNPEITEVVRVCTQRGEDARDICTLQGVGYLNAKESETQIPQIPKT